MHPENIYRYCTGYILTNVVILSAANCIAPYEKKPFFAGVYVVIENKRNEILSMETSPYYKMMGKNEFDIGLITVSEIIDFKEFEREIKTI